MEIVPHPSHPFNDTFTSLDKLLQIYQPLWRHRPFIDLEVPWKRDYPELFDQLNSLSLPEAEFLEENPDGLSNMVPALATIRTEMRNCSHWSLLDRQTDAIQGNAPRWVPGNKWSQVRDFGTVVLKHVPEDLTGWIDWCSGKAHLGRTLAKCTQLPSIGLERESSLCSSGQKLSDFFNSPLTMNERDVLEGNALSEFPVTHGVVSLHSCGQLNETLVRQAVIRQQRFIALAPCCYQNISGSHHVPLSKAGSASKLVLDRDDLRLPTLDEVTAGKKRKDLRKRAQVYRLSYDLLAKEILSEDGYHRFDRVPAEWFLKPFSEFAQRVFDSQDLALPATWDATFFEKEGWERLRKATALGLVRSIFRRPIENWLILDRALHMLENGYYVRIGTFCPRRLSPRNIMILAVIL